MSGYPAGTVTFLFTDIERSTALWERDSTAARSMVERHIVLIRQGVQANGGVHFKTIGDATQSAFFTAPCGVAAALAAQRALREEPWPHDDARPKVRMALHAGAAEPRDGDYLAACLNRLSRLLDAAHGEQILLSETVEGLARDALPADVTLVALGEHRLRDILQPEEIFQLRHPALPGEFPPLNTPGRLPHNLPIHPTPFLGREREVEEVVALLLQPDVRLVTLTGPGGVGKTRLGLRVAAEALEAFPDGAFLVDLARQAEPDLVPSATATALGLREQSGQTLTETLIAYLRERRMLLLFDNFEHVLDAATMVAELLAAAPGLKVLATSRARLGLQAEHEYRVDPLPVPDHRSLPPLDALSRYDAIALFTARARALRPGFRLTNENARAVAEIVCQLDGLPLAIELAAARVKLLSPEALRGRLDRRLSTLVGGARDLPARQRTLRDTIAWSHDLLAPPEKALFRRLSVFVAGWTIEAAEALAAVDDDEPIDAWQSLATLVDQSLVDERSEAEGIAGEPRYGMLETIRDFAAEQLAASGETLQAERACERFLIGRAQAAEVGLSGPEQPVWLERLEADHANLRAALGRACDRGDAEATLQLAPRLWQFWWMRGYLGEGRAWLERALEMAPPNGAPLRALAEFGLGKICSDLGDYTAARRHFEACVALRRERGDLIGVAEGLRSLAVVALNLRDYAEAQALGSEALRIARAHADARVTGRTLHDLGLIAREQGEYERARELLQESLALWRGIDDPFWIASAALGLGITDVLRGQAAEARAPLAEARALYEQIGDRYGVAVAATEMGHLAWDSGDAGQAIALFGEALRYFSAIGASEAIVYCLECIAAAAAERGEAAAALRLFGAAASARMTLQLPPSGERDARLVNEGMVHAAEVAGGEARALLAAGRGLSLDQARNEARRLVDDLAASAPASAIVDHALD